LQAATPILIDWFSVDDFTAVKNSTAADFGSSFYYSGSINW
jgi:hypothetical protein